MKCKRDIPVLDIIAYAVAEAGTAIFHAICTLGGAVMEILAMFCFNKNETKGYYSDKES